MIYLDNSATTKVRPQVLEAMLPYLSESYGNPSSIHSLGRTARAAVDNARNQVSSFLGCLPSEVYFSSCATMSNNVALLGRARFVEANGLPKHLITSTIEHPAVFGPAQYLEAQGWRVTYLPVDREGFVSLSDFEKALDTDTSIVSIMWGNNEIGVLEPVEAMAEMVENHSKSLGRDIFMHTDAVQIPGKLPIDLSRLKVSALSLSGHKFGAPKGIGILFLRRLFNIMPIIFGGGQEMGMFAGTESVAHIVAIGEAAKLAQQEQVALEARLRSYQKQLLEHLLALKLDLTITGPNDIAKRLPGHVSFSVNGIEGEALVLKSDLKGLALSSGSACHQGIIEASSVLKAIGLGQAKSLGAVRITFGADNTDSDVVESIRLLELILGKVRKTAQADT
ncbi:MAG: cysteine desulfurase NifS [Cyanobacteria bacterium PR.023]|nr:cysteine desulfurase NifS [Cyanobacteria bacterium PR.023]